MTRLADHALLYEGAAFTSDGFIVSPFGGTSGAGHAKCECGALSERLASSTQRKQWHRTHKADLTPPAAGEEAGR
jgi:hypothetical protein